MNENTPEPGNPRRRFKGALPKLALRVIQPAAPLIEGEMFRLRAELFQRTFTIDPEMGFRPHRSMNGGTTTATSIAAGSASTR